MVAGDDLIVICCKVSFCSYLNPARVDVAAMNPSPTLFTEG